MKISTPCASRDKPSEEEDDKLGENILGKLVARPQIKRLPIMYTYEACSVPNLLRFLIPKFANREGTIEADRVAGNSHVFSRVRRNLFCPSIYQHSTVPCGAVVCI